MTSGVLPLCGCRSNSLNGRLVTANSSKWASNAILSLRVGADPLFDGINIAVGEDVDAFEPAARYVEESIEQGSGERCQPLGLNKHRADTHQAAVAT